MQTHHRCAKSRGTASRVCTDANRDRGDLASEVEPCRWAGPTDFIKLEVGVSRLDAQLIYRRNNASLHPPVGLAGCLVLEDYSSSLLGTRFIGGQNAQTNLPHVLGGTLETLHTHRLHHH
jgi:hypothetical protein